ncbi:hypothetical protein [Zunongwangia sp.]|uniref:hypothetical protein n=1 Tax=Zunongwangia sp. TaxID=1965325 RepID=UPI003AA8FA45
MDKEIDFKELEKRWQAIKDSNNRDRQQREFQDHSEENMQSDRKNCGALSNKGTSTAGLRESREFRSFSRR